MNFKIGIVLFGIVRVTHDFIKVLYLIVPSVVVLVAPRYLSFFLHRKDVQLVHRQSLIMLSSSSSLEGILQKNQNSDYNERDFYKYMFHVREKQNENNRKFLTAPGTHGFFVAPSLTPSLYDSYNESVSHKLNVANYAERVKQANFNYNVLEEIQPHDSKQTVTDSQAKLLSFFPGLSNPLAGPSSGDGSGDGSSNGGPSSGLSGGLSSGPNVAGIAGADQSKSDEVKQNEALMRGLVGEAAAFQQAKVYLNQMVQEAYQREVPEFAEIGLQLMNADNTPTDTLLEFINNPSREAFHALNQNAARQLEMRKIDHGDSTVVRDAKGVQTDYDIQMDEFDGLYMPVHSSSSKSNVYTTPARSVDLILDAPASDAANFTLSPRNLYDSYEKAYDMELDKMIQNDFSAQTLKNLALYSTQKPRQIKVADNTNVFAEREVLDQTGAEKTGLEHLNPYIPAGTGQTAASSSADSASTGQVLQRPEEAAQASGPRMSDAMLEDIENVLAKFEKGSNVSRDDKMAALVESIPKLRDLFPGKFEQKSNGAFYENQKYSPRNLQADNAQNQGKVHDVDVKISGTGAKKIKKVGRGSALGKRKTVSAEYAPFGKGFVYLPALHELSLSIVNGDGRPLPRLCRPKITKRLSQVLLQYSRYGEAQKTNMLAKKDQALLRELLSTLHPEKEMQGVGREAPMQREAERKDVLSAMKSEGNDSKGVARELRYLE